MIITAKNLAQREGHKSTRERIVKISRSTWNGKTCGVSVKARIDFGRWIADCECGGAEYVDPEEPLFFCASCLNAQYGGAARPVVFPSNTERREIEKLIEDRPVVTGPGKDEIEKSFRAKPVVPGLSRSWNPGETISDLKLQNKAGLKAVKSGL
jgi:hypothetical protein